MTGRVRSFDDQRGLGVVETGDGTELPFHCTAVADGSRHVNPGTAVMCTVVAGHLGREEVGALAPIDVPGTAN